MVSRARTALAAGILAVVAGALARAASPGGEPPARPPIVGIAHIRLRTHDLVASRRFYTGALGLPERLLPGPGGPGTGAAFRVNDRQSVELVPGLADPRQDRLVQIAFETTDAERLRGYLALRGAKVPAGLATMPDGSRGFDVGDPDGHTVEFVEFAPGRGSGEFPPGARLSERMIHVGIVVGDRSAADRFYKDLLGFREIWHGGMTDASTDWVDLRLGEGTDWLEYMLNVKNPSPAELGVMHHLALGVPSVAEGYRAVAGRGLSPEKPQIGRDGKWQLNLYDPSGTRVELMEPRPVRSPCCSPFVE